MSLEPTKTLLYDSPNPKTKTFRTFIEFEDFDSASRAIMEAPKLLNKVIFAEWSNKGITEPRNRGMKPPPTPGLVQFYFVLRNLVYHM